MSRFPGAMQRSSRCFAEPGSPETPRFVRPRLCSAPLREELRAALRPGNVPRAWEDEDVAASNTLSFPRRPGPTREAQLRAGPPAPIMWIRSTSACKASSARDLIQVLYLSSLKEQTATL
jgi:hypothetical protein